MEDARARLAASAPPAPAAWTEMQSGPELLSEVLAGNMPHDLQIALTKAEEEDLEIQSMRQDWLMYPRHDEPPAITSFREKARPYFPVIFEAMKQARRNNLVRRAVWRQKVGMAWALEYADEVLRQDAARGQDEPATDAFGEQLNAAAERIDQLEATVRAKDALLARANEDLTAERQARQQWAALATTRGQEVQERMQEISRLKTFVMPAGPGYIGVFRSVNDVVGWLEGLRTNVQPTERAVRAAALAAHWIKERMRSSISCPSRQFE